MTFFQRIKRKILRPREIIEGYEAQELVETVFQKTLEYNPRGDWPLVRSVRTVIDFGGGAGLHYKLAQQQSPSIRWAIIETPAMVRRAKELETDNLKFFEQIDTAADWLGGVDLVHSNGAIQYVPDAEETIRHLCATIPKALVWYRVPLSEGASRREIQTSFLSDNGPGQSASSKEKLVRYERNWLPEKLFIQAHGVYRLAERGPDSSERGTQQFKFVRQ
jgi:putative methyltransferase (TIGR04325 family)